VLFGRRPWEEELEIIDRVMRAVSGVTDPEKMVQIYWEGVHELLPVEDYLALSRRGIEPPEYLITRSSRFSEQFNPWTQRERLPRLRGGLLGEIIYGGKPVVIKDLPSRLRRDDPAWFYLEGFQSLIASTQYDNGEALNVGISLFKSDVEIDFSIVPMMHWQAGLFGRGTQTLVLRNQLSAALAALDREIQSVGEIQRSLLPRELPSIEGFQIATHYQTSARAGGDYYDFFPLDERDWGVFIADVSGHGTPAAVLMAITHAIAHTRPGAPKPPGALLEYLNQHLARSYTASGTFVTAFYASIDPQRRRLAYSTAGHNPPRLLRQGRVLSLDQGGGLPLGIDEGERYAESAMGLEKGDLMLLYTDGITEAMAPADPSGSRELFGVERLDDILTRSADDTVETVVERVREAVTAFTAGGAATDDQTLVAMRYAG
jgi:phosphoserine phosphatase RsbU/P